MRAGRKPKPTAMKESEGTLRQDRINKKEPKTTIKIPSCPKSLTGDAKKEWRRITKLLKSLNCISELDRVALEQYCQCYKRWREAEQRVDEDGMTQISEKGVEYMSVNAQLASSYLKQIKYYLSEFGLTPSSRTRLMSSELSPEEDLMEYLRKRNDSRNQ